MGLHADDVLLIGNIHTSSSNGEHDFYETTIYQLLLYFKICFAAAGIKHEFVMFLADKSKLKRVHLELLLDESTTQIDFSTRGSAPLLRDNLLGSYMHTLQGKFFVKLLKFPVILAGNFV